MNAKMRLSPVAYGAALLLLTEANAHAASTKVYESKLGIFIFLGFCALLLVIQLVPAMMTLIGMFKGVSKESQKSPARARSH